MFTIYKEHWHVIFEDYTEKDYFVESVTEIPETINKDDEPIIIDGEELFHDFKDIRCLEYVGIIKFNGKSYLQDSTF